jgi:hypothetical protein
VRTPTSKDKLYEWHTKALHDVDLHLQVSADNEPECGWFTTRRARGGPLVPVRIWCHQDVDEAGELVDDERLRIEIDGKEFEDVHYWWQWCAGRPISADEFDYMERRRVWALYHKPNDPAANPRRKIDWRQLDMPDFEENSE